MNAQRKPAVDYADEVWYRYGRTFDRAGEYNWPVAGDTHAYGDDPTPLNRALTALALALKTARRSALAAIAGHEEASATLIRVDGCRHRGETDFVFGAQYGAGLLRVGSECLTSRLCIDDARRDTALWQLVMPMGRALRGQIGDRPEWLDYTDIVHHHLNLLFAEAAAWDRMIRTRIAHCRAPEALALV